MTMSPLLDYGHDPIFDIYEFEFSYPGNATSSAHFSIIPFRTSKFSPLLEHASMKAINSWNTVTGLDANILSTGCMTKRGHVIAFCLPELSEDRLVEIAGQFETFLLWDDAMDVLASDKQDSIAQDLIAGCLEFLRLKKVPQFDYKLNEALLNSIGDYDKFDLKVAKTKAFKLAKSIPTKSIDMSFETYKEVRATSSSTIYGIQSMLPYLTSTSPKEVASVEYIFAKSFQVVALLNDLYSFPREYEEHTKAGSLDAIQNSIALLMSGYGYTEAEASNILKQEITEGEKEIMDNYYAWESSPGQKSDSVRKHVIYTLLAIGGYIYWMSHSPRYHRDDFNTTPEDRSHLISRNKDGLKKLAGYPPPASFSQPNIGLQPGEEDVSATKPTTDLFIPFQCATGDVCRGPYQHMISSHPKKMFSRFIDALRDWFHLPEKSMKLLNNAITQFSTSTYMLEDIKDGSALRHGIPTSPALYGELQAMNSSSYMVFETLQMSGEFNEPKCLKIFINAMQTVSSSQGLQLYWKFNGIFPSTSEYLTMIDSKTGMFFRLIVQLMEAESKTLQNVVLLEFATLIGRYYHIRNEYNIFNTDQVCAAQKLYSDFKEGKPSLPLVHFLEQAQSSKQILSLLRNRDSNHSELPEDIKTWILSEIKSVDSIKYISHILVKLHDRLLALLDQLDTDLGVNKRLRILTLVLR